jgi:hypothetical protein
MTRKRIAPVALLATAILAAAVLTTACTSSSNKPKATGTTHSATTPATAASIAAAFRTGVDSLTSTSVTVHAGSLLHSLTGNLELSDGTITASKLAIGTGSSATTVVTIGSTSYTKLALGKCDSDKAWAKVYAGSKNSCVRALEQTLSVVQAATSLGGIADLLASATGVTSLGSASIGGVATTHYSLTVHGSSSGSALSSLLALAGSSGVPTELWLDSSGRPVQVQFTLSLLSATAVITLGSFNAPVSITAPPAADVLEH